MTRFLKFSTLSLLSTLSFMSVASAGKLALINELPEEFDHNIRGNPQKVTATAQFSICINGETKEIGMPPAGSRSKIALSEGKWTRFTFYVKYNEFNGIFKVFDMLISDKKSPKRPFLVSTHEDNWEVKIGYEKDKGVNFLAYNPTLEFLINGTSHIEHLKDK